MVNWLRASKSAVQLNEAKQRSIYEAESSRGGKFGSGSRITIARRLAGGGRAVGDGPAVRPCPWLPCISTGGARVGRGGSGAFPDSAHPYRPPNRLQRPGNLHFTSNVFSLSRGLRQENGSWLLHYYSIISVKSQQTFCHAYTDSQPQYKTTS